MKVEHKLFTGVDVEFKRGASYLGQATAVFSRYNVIDKDGDVTLPGAIRDGIEVPVSAYQHTSWTGALPVGKAIIRTDHQTARAEVQFFMTTQAGRDTFEVVRELGTLGQWSYGFDTLEASKGKFEGEDAQFLKRLRIHEVSPVLVGAGVDTATEDVKAAINEYARFQRGLFDDQVRDELAGIQQHLELVAIREAM